jgi:FkbM family methyltransferase
MPAGFERTKGFYWPAAIDVDFRRRYISGVHAVKRSVDECDVRRLAVQAGGHAGVWPNFLARYFKQVVTFEPHPLLFSALKLNAAVNVRHYNLALGNSTDEIEFVRQGGTMGGSHIDKRAAKKGRDFIMVKQMRLDSYQLSPNLIVLDIEGSELDAILGAEETISRCRPVLHLELCGHIERYERGASAELRKFLIGYGYEEIKRVNKDAIFVCKRGVRGSPSTREDS